MSKYDVEHVIDKMMAAANMVEQCQSELRNMGFSEKETAELVQVYVYNRLIKEA